jgi:nicotinate-nucleotide adenylyltransferase
MARTRKKRRIGILGGLFDPPHIAHLIIAQWVLDEFELDQDTFIPAANPPHKIKYSPYPLRYKMTRLAIKGNKRFSISDVEKRINGKTYTFEVLERLRKKEKGEFYLIIGSDQWQEIETWKNPEHLFREARIIVVPRPHAPIQKSHRFLKRILISNSPLLDISSTLIRDMITQNIDIRYLVPPPVYNFIKTKKIYR